MLDPFFLLNKESREWIGEDKSDLDFKYDFGTYRATDRHTPETAVAYYEEFVLGLY
jgi:hypothetical protein